MPFFSSASILNFNFPPLLAILIHLRLFGFKFMCTTSSRFWAFWETSFNRLLAFLGPILVCFGTTAIWFIIYIYFYCILPWLYNDKPVLEFKLQNLLNIFVSIYLAAAIFWNYFASVLALPKPLDTQRISADQFHQLQIQTFKISGQVLRYCKFCQIIKENRMHHCHICKRCIAVMDHHCPWIWNCVGEHNHHFFILLNLYLTFGSIYFSSLAFLPFINALSSDYYWSSCCSRTIVIFSFILSSTLLAALLGLTTQQFYLFFSGKTSIENHYQKTESDQAFDNPYDRGPNYHFEKFFGIQCSRPWFLWLIPGQVKLDSLKTISLLSRNQAVIQETLRMV
ncbi:uncharacterized protein LOC126326236 [Schistocerca gregaria]|uniref:uncharacterized protein LOC126326236 n=1 Tax=Schistocerca gregaria TaxID=7010 RepID=UPI00211E6125|nr:uncharacterized protein LOC126326236 [Schistocerca gregaria]